ncbi:MAG: hypothetical protein B6230_04660 [Desulfobacteraceae bacterium 4572_89]|nr:MAG: hypothetical protein B6230_04660 [Desulfobacteraceae bacterium 4572_89]
MTNGRTNQIPLIGLLAVKNKLIKKEELEKGLALCKNSSNLEKDLTEYLCSNELVSAKNMERLSRAVKTLEIRQKEYKFGAIAIAKGFINKTVLDLALEEQLASIRGKQKPRLIGDLMVEAGMLTAKQRNYILKLQNRVRQMDKNLNASQKNQPGQKALEPNPPKKVEIKKENSDLLEPEIITGGIKLQVSSDFMADGFIRSSGFKTQSFRVAQGTKLIQGQDAKLEFFFNTDYLKAGGLDSDGNIDFKQRGEIPLVDKGTVLAEKTPMVKSRCGQNIYGEEVEALAGNDIPLRLGKGAKLSEDGLKVLAAVRGYPKYTLSGVIFVHEEYTTSGDVDYETGHVDYDGNVNIKGCIKSGFRVRGNDIKTIELDGGIVEAQGDLVVAGGINEGKIYARGNVFAKFIHKSEIICMGNVHAATEIVDSDIESSGSCSIENGKLISSRVTAKMGVNARNIGTEMAAPNMIKVGYDIFTEKELEKNKTMANKLKEKIQDHKEKKEKLKEQDQVFQQKISKLAQIQDRSQIEQRQIQLKTDNNDTSSSDSSENLSQHLEQLKINADNAEKILDQCFEKSEAIEEAIEKTDKNIDFLAKKLGELFHEKNNLVKWAKENPGKAVVTVDGEIQTATVISGKHSEMIVEQVIRHARVMEVIRPSEDSENSIVHEMQIQNI